MNDTKPSVAKYELANALTHGFGLLLCLVGLPFLLTRAYHATDLLPLMGFTIFSISLFCVYLSSTLYHSVKPLKWKRRLRKIDHVCIYLLIAGTHTPFIFLFLNNTYGYIFLVLLWLVAIGGIVHKLFFIEHFPRLSLLYYFAMGWSALFTIGPMMELMSWQCFYWILIGGTFYTIGTLFFIWERLAYHHAIWHLFVIGGSTGHFVALMYAV